MHFATHPIEWRTIANHIVYRLLALIVLALPFFVISRFFIGNLADAGSTESRLLYGLLGTTLIIIIDPVAQWIRFQYNRIRTGHAVNYRSLYRSILASFNTQSEFFVTCDSITVALEEAFGFSSVQLNIRFRGRYYTMCSNQEEDIHQDHPVLQLLKGQELTPSTLGIYRRGNKLVQWPYSDLSEQVLSYMKENGITYILPLHIERQLFGWIECSTKTRRHHLTYADREFLEQLQPLLAVGLRRASMNRHLATRVQELEALHRIGQTMNSSLNAAETLESIMDAVFELVGSDRTLLYVEVEDGIFRPTIGRGVDEGINLDFTIDVTKSIFKYIIDTKESLIVTDVHNDPRVNKEYAGQVRTNSFAAVPIISKEKVIGIIGVDNLYTNRPVNKLNLALLTTLAQQAAMAIENSSLYEQTIAFNAELQKKVAEATAHLQGLLDIKSHFLSVASHQLRTPTTLVKGFLSMLDEDDEMEPDEQRKLISQAYRSMDRLEQIISELLSATKLEDTTITPHLETVELDKLCTQIQRELQPLAEKKGVDLFVHVDETAAQIESDGIKLKEAITNLVDNAIRYTPDGSVKLTVESDDRHAVITVQDTGVGLTPEDKQILFQRFQRGENIAEIEPQGTGLGLFIVKRVVEVLAGDIEVESEGPGKGTTFTIRLPLSS